MHETLVGRESETQRLFAALDLAASGGGGLIVVTGEAGIGKSALARLFVQQASARAFRTALGRAWEAGGAPPLWPWTDVLRELVPSVRAADLGTFAALATLVPESLPSDLPPLAPLDEGQARFRLFDTVLRLLRRLAKDGPVAIVFEDLHVADEATLALLRFVADAIAGSAVAILATWRDPDAKLGASAPHTIHLGSHAHAIRLPRLSRSAVENLVEQAGYDPDVARRLFSSTEGNPLFLVEAIRLLRATGDADALPSASRDVMRQRLGLLPAETREALEVGAAEGREFDVGVVAGALRRSRSVTVTALRAATEAEVIAARGADRYVFTHVLLRDVLYQDISEARRVAVHHALGMAIEQRASLDARTRTMGLARHFLEAAPVAGMERAVSFAQEAAERALELHAHEEAVAFLERALTLLDDGGDEALRFEVILSIGRACMRGGAPDRGRRACRDAAAIARARGAHDDLARVALAFGEHTIFAFIDPELTALLEEALAALGDANPPLRARLLARLAAALQPAEDPLGPIALAREAVSLARHSGDAKTRLEVLFAAGSALGYFADPNERLPLDLELTEIAKVLGDQVKLARGLARVCIDHWELGDRDAAVAIAAEHSRVAEALGLASHRRTAILLGNVDAILSGRFDEAADAIARAETIPTPSEPGVRVPIAGQALALAFARTDEAAVARADGPMREALGTTFDTFYTLAIATRIDAMLGRTDALRRGLQEARHQLEALRHRPMAGFLADGVAQQRDVALAEALYEMVAPYRHRNHGWGIGLMVLEGPFTEVLGVLAQACGRLPEAIADFEDALTRAEAMGARPHAARIRVRLAEALETRGAPGDVARADALRRTARATAEMLGMPGLLARLQAPAARSTSIDVRLLREGDVWRVRVGTTEHVLKHFRGLEILAELVAHPGEERHVFDLLGVEFDGGDAGPALDARAIASYKTRVTELQQDIDEAESEGRSEVAAHLQDEIEAIARELSRGTGMRGRPRKERAAIERARVNVRRRIVLAIEQIAAVAPELARHLESSVQTGIHCVYRPVS